MRPLFALLSLVVPAGLLAAPVHRPHIEAELIAATTAVEPGEPLTLALRLKADRRWHTYWKNPGDSGLPTRIQWTLPPGFEAGPIQWPTPSRIDIGPLANYGYEGEVLLLTDIRTPADVSGSVPIQAMAKWLVCEQICIPGEAEFALALPVGPATPDPMWASRIEATRAALPRVVDGVRATATLAGEEWLIEIPRAAAPELTRLAFFPDQDGWINYASKQRLTAVGDKWRLRFAAAPNVSAKNGELSGLLVAEPGFADGSLAANVSAAFGVGAALPPEAPATNRLSLVLALGFAFAGGLILNLMPCVFPIVSIKVLGFVAQASGDRASLRAHGLLFAAGVLACFWAIAGALLLLRAGGAALGWGYQLQSPLVIGALAMLFFALALNLSGVFHFGDSMQRLAGSVRARSGYLDAFLSGSLATAVATPCTAPFMGAALGFALTQSALTAMLTFTALALGMATPYVVLSFAPGWMNRLPRPGPWMDTLKQIFAFPLYLTTVWLVWVLGRQIGVDGAARLLVGLTLLGAALWALGRWSYALDARVRHGGVAAAAALFALAFVVAWPVASKSGAPQAADAWKPWSRAAVAQEQAAGKAVFVEFTAAWCVTCQVNKRLVLQRQSVMDRFTQRQVVLMRADWTSQNPEITAALKELGRSGVPVYALYPAGGGAPALLPEILTEARVMDAIDTATPGRAVTATSN
ncbi:MAG TPA: thioredoxin family protein [Burkholderiales bacterium]|nr:thioredoxin family protein [Burkholderiales bacterium]